MSKPFYITTTLPYVNGEPHIGFALEIIEADVIARSQKEFFGSEVAFNTGTDEHGVNIYRKALELGQSTEQYVNSMASNFQDLKELLHLSTTHFIRTTDAHHIAAAQAFWQRCFDNGDIYKKEYLIQYCPGCELQKTDSELDKEGKCLLHPTKEIETIEEENYFFRFSKYQESLLTLYQERPDFVQPKKRQNEIENFVKKGIEDFSISRVQEKMPWGVPVPGDDTQVMYVWFDALVSYIATLGWPEDQINFKKWWPAVQIAGKDNLRQQAAMWQAMLLSAGMEPSRTVLINGFINVDGQKMSKSLGNSITPVDLVSRYGVDGARYLLLSLGPIGEDFDLSFERLQEKYNADLANGLGNLVSRSLRLAERLTSRPQPEKRTLPETFLNALLEYRLSDALQEIFAVVNATNEFLSKNEPWKMGAESQDEFDHVLTQVLNDLSLMSQMLNPFLPETSTAIQKALESGEAKPLFQRLS